MKVGLIYTSTTPELIELVEQEVKKQLGDDVELFSLQDPSILADVRAAGYVTTAPAARLIGMYMQAAEAGVDAMLNLCSSVGEVADCAQSVAKYIGVPIVRVDEEMCREVAQAGGGAFIHVENNSAAQDQLDSELDKLAKKETETTIYSDYDEQFMAFAILAILLLVIEVCILDIKNPMMKHLSLFKRKKYGLILLALCLSSLSVNAQNDRSLIRHGNKEFRAGNYANAEVDYRKALEKNPKNSQALFNLGNTLFAQRKDSAAIQNYENATNIETNPKRKAMAYHNIGVVCQNHKMYGEAIEAYKNALRLNPHDDQTRYNLELCKRQKQKQDQQNKENQKQQNKDDKNKDKNKDKKENQKKDKDQQQQKEKDKDQPQNKPKMSKENAEQLLNAAMQQEKATQQKMKEAQRQQGRRRLEKNW